MTQHKAKQLALSFDDLPPEYERLEAELWTSRQRQKHSLHYVISYRASFKPELPEYFIERYTKPGDVVLDPFMGRGTTLLQANLMGRVGWGNDANPMAARVSRAKCRPVSVEEVTARLSEMDLERTRSASEDAGEPELGMFYHQDTLKELRNLRDWLREHRTDADAFIELVALSRLHGHSPGFFSVYSFPQISVPPQRQVKINEQREQVPDHRPIAPRIIRKAKSSLRDADVSAIRKASRGNKIITGDSAKMKLPSDSVDLVVTSPPFLDKADYIADNWLEMWFLGVDSESLNGRITQVAGLPEWREFMTGTMQDISRVLRPGGTAVIEVGEVVRRGEVLNLDETIADIARELWQQGGKLFVRDVLINVQEFTKLANCFSVTNNEKGTNTQRMVVLEKAR